MSAEAVKAVLDAFPQAAVMVRAFDRVHMIELDGLDIAFAERELFEGAVAMGRAALKASGIDKAEVDRVDGEYRMRDCERLERQSATGDLHAGSERAFSAERVAARCRTGRAGSARARCRHIIGERADDRIDHILVRAIAAFHVDMRFLVGWPALFGQSLQRRLGIGVAKLRPGVAARRPLGEDLDGRVEPHGDRAFVEQLSGVRIDKGAAARGDDSHVAFDQARNQAALAVAEVILAVPFEHLRGE